MGGSASTQRKVTESQTATALNETAVIHEPVIEVPQVVCESVQRSQSSQKQAIPTEIQQISSPESTAVVKGSSNTLRSPVPDNSKELAGLVPRRCTDNSKFSVTKVDPQDVGTPDEWVWRHPDLVRLTGRHPFNCEPPVPLLMEAHVEAGSLTPASIHYVRNHAAAPKITWEEHRIVFEYDGQQQHVFKMDDLTSMPKRTIPVLLVCAGNRRKECNMIRQTQGFNWGSGGLSTSSWSGVPMHIFLKKYCGITEVTDDHQFLCFRGPLGEIPKGEDGSYGTSIPLRMALDPAADVMLAWEQNGKLLEPDHGYPIRIIIPGYIGGRMVKFLSHMSLTRERSDNFFHFQDNRILPSHVLDNEQAVSERWWWDEKYIFNQLNINSTITSPAHDEVISHKDGINNMYTVRGYAYTGGGRAITRVEFSMDGGDTWQMAQLQDLEPTEYGMYWTWWFWSIQVSTKELQEAGDLVCRAWDEATNTQPPEINWNLLGMGNNAWFRVKSKLTEVGDYSYMHFEHPTQPGQLKGGWMGHTAGGWQVQKHPTGKRKFQRQSKVEKVWGIQEAPSAVKVTDITTEAEPRTVTNLIPMTEVAKHNTKGDCWIVIAGKVYDATTYLEKHPGGAESILIGAGTDVTEDFEAIHSQKAWKMLDPYHIGDVWDPSNEQEKPSNVIRNDSSRDLTELDKTSAKLLGRASEDMRGDDSARGLNLYSNLMQTNEAPQDLIALDPSKRIPFVLQSRTIVNHNTRILRFALQSEKHVFGLPVGKHVLISARINGKLVMRAYTPMGDGPGYFDLLIKVYFANQHPKFPEGGLLSQHMDSLKVGDTIDVKGPIGHVLYEGKGNYLLKGEERFHTKKLCMLAGGTGITPIWQVMNAICNDPADSTEIYLIFANNSWNDLMLYDELIDLQAKNPNVHVHFTLSQPPTDRDWNYSAGYISEQMMRDHFPSPSDEPEFTSVFICGPPGMIEHACLPNLQKLNFDMNRVVQF